MTDPIVQDQNQNGQNPQTTQTPTPELDFDLNLQTNEDDTAKKEPVISLDFDEIEKTKIDTPIETNVNDAQVVTEKTSVAEEVIPVAEETPVVAEETPVTEETIPSEIKEEIQPNTEKSPEEATAISENNVIASDNEAIHLDADINEKPAKEDHTVSEETTPISDKETQINTEISSEDTKQPENIESNPIDEIATEFPLPKKSEEIEKSETKEDNRIEQEDALVEQNKESEIKENNIVETKKEPEVKEETLNIFNESTEKIDDKTEKSSETIKENQNETTKIEEVKNENTQIEQNLPTNTNLEQDHAIIAQLQESAGKPIEQIPVVATTPTSTEVNLDDLLNAPTPTPIESNPSNIPNPSNLPKPSNLPAFTGIQGYPVAPIATQISEQIKKPLNKKILINIGIGISIFFVGWFMFKTMYPLEYQKMIGKGPQPTTIENQLTDNSITPIEEETGAVAESDLFNNPALANYHGSAPELSGGTNEVEDDFNAFEDIEENLTETDNKTIERIQNYIDVGRQYTVIGKKNNDKEIMKYSLFLYKKALTLLTDIENGTQISTDELDKQLSDLESYLQKLTGKNSDGEIVLQQQTQPTPEEFFGTQNSGSSQEPETTEESTTTESGATNENETTTQENETENLSGDENSIIQPNELNG